MTFRLVDTGWNDVLSGAMRAEPAAVRIICPFIKERVVKELLKDGHPESFQVITRFNLGDFCKGVSDIGALRRLLEVGALVRGVRNLHAKLYLFGEDHAIVTSANLTQAGLNRNHEFGFVAEDESIIGRCRQYFDELWSRSGQDLTADRLTEMERKVTEYLASGARPADAEGLGDEGVNAGISTEPITLPTLVDDAVQAFVKFFGESHNRAHRSMAVLNEVQRSGCHWACTYPKGKRPRQVKDGAVMFMGRLVKEPNDILIYGRAVGIRHDEDRDDATNTDISLRPWKAKWPHYVRVHHAEFIGGTLANGISLNELMNSLQSDAFMATQRNAVAGQGNRDPRKAYMQQPAVELTQLGMSWLNERLQLAYESHGRVPPSALEQLDWPQVPMSEEHGD